MSPIQLKSFTATLTTNGYPEAIDRLDNMVNEFLRRPEIKFHSLQPDTLAPEIEPENALHRSRNPESFVPCLIRVLVYSETSLPFDK